MKKRSLLSSSKSKHKNKKLNKLFLLALFLFSFFLPFVVREKASVDYIKKETINRIGGIKKIDDSREVRHLKLFSEKQKPLIMALSDETTAESTAEKAVEICSDLKGAKFREIQHCYSEVLYFVAKKKGQKFAFTTISHILSNPKNTAKACHIMAHGVGNGIYDKDPLDWQNAIGNMTSECSYGGIHGVLESYSSSGNDPFDKKKISAICAKNHDPACYHGLGHVIIAQMENNLDKATELCYVLSEKGAQSNCLNGVFMENMIGQTLEVHGLVSAERRQKFYEHLDEFIELCNSQTNKDLIRACWVETIHASVTRFSGDAEKVFELCARAQTADAARGCRLHSLAELVPRKGFDPFESAYMCKISVAGDKGFEKDCYNMIVSVIMANSPGKIDQTINFCSTLTPEYKSQCLAAVKRQVSTLRSQDPDKADSICQNVLKKSQSVCDGS
jgi:hypothetical protein